SSEQTMSAVPLASTSLTTEVPSDKSNWNLRVSGSLSSCPVSKRYVSGGRLGVKCEVMSMLFQSRRRSSMFETLSRFLPFSSELHHPRSKYCGWPPPGTSSPVIRSDSSVNAQRLSMHSPRAQSASSSHGSSSAEGSRHAPPTHTASPAHSALALHVVSQDAFPQRYGAHSADDAGPQSPRPSQVRVPYSTPPVQVASAQTVPASYRAQPPLPSQSPV